jgi:trehalose/maltose transport system permease protein
VAVRRRRKEHGAVSQQVVSASPGKPKPSLRERFQNEDTPRSQWAKSRERLAWLLVTPAILVVCGIALYPLGQTIYLSFTNANLQTSGSEWVGLRNYERLWNSTLFRDAVIHTIQFTVVTVFFETVLGMIIALTINSNFQGRGLVRTSMLVPWAIPTIVSAQMWAWMYHDVFGVVNDILVKRLGILDEPIAWTTGSTALWAIIAVDIWKTTPFMTLLLLAGLQIIPGDVYEAATVDGASKWQQFWQITLPLVRPALVVALIFRTLDAFRVFDVVQIMTAYSPKTMTVAVFAQQNFSKRASGFGMTAASSVFILVFIMVLVVIYTRMAKVEEG